jgi:hypothetical protein
MNDATPARNAAISETWLTCVSNKAGQLGVARSGASVTSQTLGSV